MKTIQKRFEAKFIKSDDGSCGVGQKSIHKCSICDGGIYVGDKYKDFGGGIFCYTCMREALLPEDWLGMMEDEIQIARLSM